MDNPNQDRQMNGDVASRPNGGTHDISVIDSLDGTQNASHTTLQDHLRSVEELQIQEGQLDTWYAEMQKQLQLEQLHLKQKFEEMKLKIISEQKILLDKSHEFLRSPRNGPGTSKTCETYPTSTAVIEPSITNPLDCQISSVTTNFDRLQASSSSNIKLEVAVPVLHPTKLSKTSTTNLVSTLNENFELDTAIEDKTILDVQSTDSLLSLTSSKRDDNSITPKLINNGAHSLTSSGEFISDIRTSMEKTNGYKSWGSSNTISENQSNMKNIKSPMKSNLCGTSLKPDTFDVPDDNFSGSNNKRLFDNFEMFDDSLDRDNSPFDSLNRGSSPYENYDNRICCGKGTKRLASDVTDLSQNHNPGNEGTISSNSYSNTSYLNKSERSLNSNSPIKMPNLPVVVEENHFSQSNGSLDKEAIEGQSTEAQYESTEKYTRDEDAVSAGNSSMPWKVKKDLSSEFGSVSKVRNYALFVMTMKSCCIFQLS